MKTKMFKRLAPLAVLMIAFALTVSQSFAAFEAINKDTGANSDNEAEATEENDFDSDSFGDAFVGNFGIGIANTGGDSTDYNTGEGETSTGNVLITGGFTNGVNGSTTNYYDAWDGDFTATNDTTGAESDNDAEASLENDIEVDNESYAGVFNVAVAIGNTGLNSASYNTGAGDVEAGTATVEASELNVVNGNYTEIALEMDGLKADAENKDTGYDSDNDAEVEVENEVDVDNYNEAYVENWAFAIANTGLNRADYNTGEGTVETDEALAGVDILNGVNYNQTNIAIDLGDAELSASNDTTGANSDNDAEVEVENEVDVDNESYAEVFNVGVAVANTGINSASYNTGAGEVTTGIADSDTIIDNDVNFNVTDVDIDLGDAEISASNDTTGANSDNDAEVEVENEVDVDNYNEAYVGNVGVSVSNTGLNSADYNTGEGDVESGDATATTSVTNDVNVNDTEVNIVGTDLDASNDTTGYGSDNEAEASVENDVEVSNTNIATVDNTVVTVSNTGGNSADYNTGAGSSATGDATVVFGATNTVNVNTTTVGGDGM